MDYKEFDLQNHRYIEELLQNSKGKECDISGSVKATIAQFLMNFRIAIKLRAQKLNQDWVESSDIIDAQVSELRQCIIDLEAYKERLTKGATHQ